MLKRSFDVVCSAFGIILFSPVILLLVILIKKGDGGPAFYWGSRAGKGGKPFKILKFRTMVLNADKIGGPSTSDDDPRITPIGRVIRKYKFDEIPQLVNVFKGEMSFVGPRPEVLDEVATYTPEERRILTVRPGITDWASLTYHNEGEILKGSVDPHEAYRRLIKPGKIKLALKYVDEHSFLTDMKIIGQTVATLIKSRM
jgi:lipopolysaccharide/colanic/teichoic acid biosynthesis glycosyltransferase